jgi:hypothetical protein
MMSLINRKKRHDAELAEVVSSANLFKGDYAKVEQLRQKHNKKHAEVVRELVNQALIQQELSERHSADETGIDHPAIDALLKEGLAPILQELQDVKGCMQELASVPLKDQSSTTMSGPLAEFIQEHLKETNRWLSDISDHTEDRHSDFVRIAKLLHDRQERAERWSQAAYVLAGRSFNSMTALLDLFQRYVLVPQLAAMNPQADAVKDAKAETEASCAAAVTKRRSVERKLRLPKDGKIKFLSSPHE